VATSIKKEDEFVMKMITRLVLISVFLIVAVPAYSGGVAMQVWKCGMNDDATEKSVREHAAEWLKAAKTMKGGKNLKAQVYFPVVISNTGETDMAFAVTAPSFAEWGMFWDSYGDSAAAAADKKNELVDCPGSTLWEAFEVK